MTGFCFTLKSDIILISSVSIGGLSNKMSLFSNIPLFKRVGVNFTGRMPIYDLANKFFIEPPIISDLLPIAAELLNGVIKL